MPCHDCQHPRSAHQHFRPGTDCGLCTCVAYRGPTDGRPVAVLAFLLTLVAGAGMWIVLHDDPTPVPHFEPTTSDVR